jgi:hypothetical protein
MSQPRVSALHTLLNRWTIIWLQQRRCCHAGSNVSLTLYFLRFALGINAALAAFWLAGTVIPFIISPPNSFAWEYFKAYSPTELLQGYGLHNTFLVYGTSPSELGGNDAMISEADMTNCKTSQSCNAFLFEALCSAW